MCPKLPCIHKEPLELCANFGFFGKYMFAHWLHVVAQISSLKLTSYAYTSTHLVQYIICVHKVRASPFKVSRFPLLLPMSKRVSCLLGAQVIHASAMISIAAADWDMSSNVKTTLFAGEMFLGLAALFQLVYKLLSRYLHTSLCDKQSSLSPIITRMFLSHFCRMSFAVNTSTTLSCRSSLCGSSSARFC